MSSTTPFRWSTFAPLFGIGSALSVIYRQKAEIDSMCSLPAWVYRGSLALGLLCIAAAVILSSGSLLLSALHRAASWLSRFWEPPPYSCKSAAQTDLGTMHEYWERFFGGDISDVAQDRAWHSKNSKLFWLIFQTGTRHGKKLNKPSLVGSFSLIPLTKRAADLVARGELVGAHFTADHLIKEGHKPAAVYV